MSGLREGAMSIARCEGCGEHTLLIPLHGGKGGPLRCPLCVGKWNAEHGRKRRTGRIVIRAMMAFHDAGGTSEDIDKLETSALCGDLDIDPLGYMEGIARLDEADVDLTSDLLADVLKLVHPDHHPPERQELAHRVTQRLLALQPFVFPALKPEPPPAPTSSAIKDAERMFEEFKREPSDAVTLRTRYPCSDCGRCRPVGLL
jgi:hypothetical protein